jgi:hypothetical protein
MSRTDMFAHRPSNGLSHVVERSIDTNLYKDKYNVGATIELFYYSKDLVHGV